MKVDFEDLGGLKYRMKVTVEAADWQQHKSRLAKAYAHHVHIPGFRPGKAPLDLIARKLGPSLEAEVQEAALSQSMRDALDQRKLRPSTDPKLEIGEKRPDGSFDYTVEFESFPNIELKDYLGVQVSEPVLPEIDDEQVDGAVAHLRENLARFEDKAEGAVAMEGDLALCDVVVAAAEGDEVLVPSRESRIRVGTDDEPVKDAGRELLGLKAGESKDVVGEVGRITARGLPKVEPAVHPLPDPQPEPDPSSDAPAEPKPVVAKATLAVKKLMERRTPDLDEAFAKRVGHDTVEALKVSVRDRLEAERQEARKERLRDAVLDVIAEANPVEVGAETISRMAEMAEDEAKSRVLPGLTPEQRAGIDLGIPREQSEAEAKKNLHRMVILQTIAEKEGIEVTDEDLEAHLRALAAEHGVPLPKLRAHFDEEKLENLARRLKVDKTLDLLLRYAVVAPAATVAAPEAPAAEEAAPAADAGAEPGADPAPEATP